MKRRLLNLATILSVVLSLAALAMQVRSGYVIDSWELPPRPAPNFNAEFQSGIVTHRHIESTAGHLVWVNYNAMEMGLMPPVFYQRAVVPLAPGQLRIMRHRRKPLRHARFQPMMLFQPRRSTHGTGTLG